jgi:hypothetical protein
MQLINDNQILTLSDFRTIELGLSNPGWFWSENDIYFHIIEGHYELQ